MIAIVKEMHPTKRAIKLGYVKGSMVGLGRLGKAQRSPTQHTHPIGNYSAEQFSRYLTQ